MLQAAVDWSWAIPALTVPTLAAAGVVLAAAAPGVSAHRARPGALAAGALGAAVAIAMISATLPWWSGHVAAQGEDALADGRPRVAIDRARDAHAANPLTIGPLLLLGQAYDDLQDRRRALGAFEEATRRPARQPGRLARAGDLSGARPGGRRCLARGAPPGPAGSRGGPPRRLGQALDGARGRSRRHRAEPPAEPGHQ